jgi:hypothetical protein
MVALAAAVVALVICAQSSAVAQTDGRAPVVREPIREAFSEEIDPFALDACGVEVRSETRIRGQFVLYSDLSARTHLNIEIVYTDPETGEVLLVERDAETFLDDAPTSETIDEDAGTRTVVFESTITGLPLNSIVPGDGVLIRDAGRISETITVVYDLETGEQLSLDEEFTDMRGPHPFIELTPQERDALFCSVVSQSSP